jgi:hypothetical protein
VPELDSLQLDGFWPGTAGKLQSGPGFELKNGSPFPFVALDTVSYSGAGIFYGGGGGLGRVGVAPGGHWYVDNGYDGSPLGILPYREYLWVINPATGKQRRIDLGSSAASNWTVETPTIPGGATAGGGSLADGDYDYYVTFEDVNGYEGNPSPPVTVTAASGGTATNTITRPNATETDSLGAQVVTGWNLYRQSVSNGMVVAYRLNQAVKAYASTTIDDFGTPGLQDDASIIKFDIPIEFDHDAPPKAAVMANQLFNGRIAVANSADYPNRIWFTNALQPGWFPGAPNDALGNWVDVGTDSGDAVLAMLVRPGMMVIYRQRSIWVQRGDFDDPNGLLQVMVPGMGIVGRRAAVSSAGGDFFCNGGNLYLLADWPIPVAENIESIFRQSVNLRRAAMDSAGQMDEGTRTSCALGFDGSRLWFSYSTSASTGNEQTFVYHISTKRWFHHPLGYGAFSMGGNIEVGDFLGVDAAGNVFAINTTQQSQYMTWQGRYEDCGHPDREKTFADLVIPNQISGGGLTVTAKLNKGAESWDVDTLANPTLTRQTIPLIYPSGPNSGLPLKARNLSVFVEGQGGPLMSTLETPFLLHYYLEARRGRTFDTGNINHGTVQPKSIDWFEFDIDTTEGAVALTIWSDIPGGLLTIRGAPIPIPQVVGRNVARIVLPDDIDGRLFRYFLQSAGDWDFALYGYRVRVLPIGVYVDGTMGEFWDIQPLSIGV